MKKKRDEKPDFNKYNLKPAKFYLDDLKNFASFMDDISGKNLEEINDAIDRKGQTEEFSSFLDAVEEAQKAAEELIRETTVIQPEKRDGKQPDVKASQDTAAKESEPQSAQETTPEQTVEELMAELDELVGLDKIKANVKSLINLVRVRKLREENGLPSPAMSLHLVFMGNPGTGKTTVARLISKLYKAIGVLSKGQLIEVDRSGLVAGYVGQTAIKTGEVIKSALGGVLFIDEVYALASGGGDGTADFGREAIETLLKSMEDNRDDLVVIVAGYEGLMEKFISSNPGLESRFNRYFVFEDFTPEELFAIFKSMCEKNSYTVTPEAEKFAKEHLQYLYDTRDDNFGNARDVRNLFENIVSAQADRLAAMEAPTRDDLVAITKEDIENASVM